MASIKNVAVAGASGSIGSAIVKALLDANFTVTALSRPDSTATFPSGVKVAKIDYNDAASIASAMQNQDDFVSAVGYAAILSQKQLIDAAIAAGVKRIIPSEYGADQDNARARNLPVFGHKVEVEKYLKQKVQGTETTYSLICNNEFFDWDLDNNFGVNISSKTIEIFDGGNTPYTAAPLSFVASGVASVLQHPEETANRVVRLHGMTMTQNRMLAMLQKYTGADGWTVSHATTKEREREGYEMLEREPGNFVPWAMAFLDCAVFGAEFGVDFSGRNDNEVLGLRELSDAEVEEIVKGRC